ncbi:MAG: histidine kinase [Desulfobacteraceae bacterium]|nr:histidine kinase [Desulfobacteraceae bacterium]
MYIQNDTSGTLDGMRKLIHKVASCKDVKALMVLACDQNEFTPDQADPLLQSLQVPVFGGIYPAIVHGCQKMEKGCIVIGLPFHANVFPIKNLSLKDDIEHCLDSNIPKNMMTQTMMVFIDGLAPWIGAFVDALFNVFGFGNNYIGGGAGSLSLKSKPCVFCGQGMLHDSAVLVSLDRPSSIGVAHGWQSAEGPYRVTKSDTNKIISLDWQPAFDVYSQTVNQLSGRILDRDNFYDLAKGYPFGITRLDAERVLRDPLSVDENGALICAGEVPEGAFVDIMNGTNEVLLAAASSAANQACQKFSYTGQEQLTFLVDCISRALYMQDSFYQEIKTACADQAPLVGICSIGELANSGTDYLEFYNKAIVVGKIGVS